MPVRQRKGGREMRISFDLDDTLICYHPDVPREPRLPLLYRLLAGDEPLRLGARSLLKTLRDRGCELWIYTTSYRSPAAVRLWLWCHGLRVARVINQAVHDAHFPRTGHHYPPSKNPGAFGIDLHIDDSDGVRMEGEQHGFSVVVVSPDDPAWTEKILQWVDKRWRR
jgi:hypothetical protein